MSRIDELIRELCPDGAPVQQLDALVHFEKGEHLSQANYEKGRFPVVTASRSETRRHARYNVEANAITVTSHGAYAGHVNFWNEPIWLAGNVFLLRPDPSLVTEKYLFYCLKNSEEQIQGRARGGGIPYMNSSDLKSIRFAVPPLEVQREIVSILDKFTQLEAELEAELEARRTQYEVTRDRLLDFSGDLSAHPMGELIRRLCPEGVPMAKVGKTCTTYRPITSVPRARFLEQGDIPVVDQSQNFIAGFTNDLESKVSVGPCIVFGDHTRERKFVDFDFAAGADGTVILVPEDSVDPKFLFFTIANLSIPSRGYNRHWSIVREMTVPLPPLQVQREIVSILDKLDALVNDITYGLPAEIEARRKQYEYYRNKLLTFKELDAA